MKKYLLKVTSVLMVLMILFTSFVFTAAAETAYVEKIDTSNVVLDLRKMGFNLEDYPTDKDAKHFQLMKFLEYGYDENGDQSDYDIYLYIYNPSGKAINTSSILNKISIQSRSITDLEQTQWKKIALEFVDSSSDTGNKNVFLKFKLKGSGADVLLDSVSKNLRCYEVSEIELHFVGDKNATALNVGGLFTYSGYQPYKNKQKTDVNTLYGNFTELLTIDLQMHATSWKTDTSGKGVGYANELFSMYFSVPNDIIKKYGNVDNDINKGLIQIDGQYDRHQINGLLVNNKDTYDVVYSSLGKVVPDSNVPFTFNSGIEVSNGSIPHNYYENSYNKTFGTYDHVINTGDRAGVVIKKITTVFNKIFTDNTSFISSAELASELKKIKYDKGTYHYEPIVPVYGPTLPNAKVYGNDITYSIKAKYENGEYVDVADQIEVYASNHQKSFWDWLFGNALYEESSYENIKSIQAINTLNVIGTNKKISDQFYISENDVDDFKNFTIAEAAKNKTTYLMRFAVDDYYATEVTLSSKDAGGPVPVQNAIYFEKVIYENVDILTFTFENKYSEKVVVPVAASPVDNLGEITPTIKPDGSVTTNEPSDIEDLYRMFAMVLGVLFILLVFYVLHFFGIYPFKILCYLFKKFVLFIKWIFKFIKIFFKWLRKEIKKLIKSLKK